MNQNNLTLIKASMFLPLVGCGSTEVAEVVRPNVILIMTDDLGYSDIACYGGTAAATPNIDQLAKDGIMLTDYHSNGAVSSPTRAALMTGKYQQRTGVTGVITAANHRESGLALEEVTIAERLSELGYNCGMFGKWHLGYPAAFNPTYQGFDEFKGFVAGNIDYHSYIDESGHYDWWNGPELDRTVDGYITDMITQNSLNFIEKNDPNKTGEPFFLYVPYPAPHYPYQGVNDGPVREEGNKKYIREVGKEEGARVYSEIIEGTDAGIGEIVALVNKLGLEENTMIIFCSDNGAGRGYGNNGGYRGHKGTVYEAGHRVPGVIKYPAVIAPNQKSDVAFVGMDFYPTFIEMAGGEVCDNMDGVSFLDFFKTGVEPAKRDLFWGHGNKVAMRAVDGWKLIEIIEKDEEPKYELYNLNDDPFETTDLVGSEADRVAKMSKAIEEWKADVFSGVEKIS
ncbi:MAG: sulfatase-like hydrolase/transferase [Rikenellaceae bacterium]